MSLQKPGIVLLVVVVLSLPLIGTAQAHNGQHSPSETISLNCEQTETVPVPHAIEVYNNNTESVPDVIGGSIASETVEFTNTDSNNSFTLQTTDSLEIDSYSSNQADDPDVIVQTDTETLCNLATASDPVSEFNSAYDSNKITIEATNTVDKAKVFIVDTAMELIDIVS